MQLDFDSAANVFRLGIRCLFSSLALPSSRCLCKEGATPPPQSSFADLLGQLSIGRDTANEAASSLQGEKFFTGRISARHVVGGKGITQGTCQENVSMGPGSNNWWNRTRVQENACRSDRWWKGGLARLPDGAMGRCTPIPPTTLMRLESPHRKNSLQNCERPHSFLWKRAPASEGEEHLLTWNPRRAAAATEWGPAGPASPDGLPVHLDRSWRGGRLCRDPPRPACAPWNEELIVRS